jgi:hypothetical protein
MSRDEERRLKVIAGITVVLAIAAAVLIAVVQCSRGVWYFTT